MKMTRRMRGLHWSTMNVAEMFALYSYCVLCILLLYCGVSVGSYHLLLLLILMKFFFVLFSSSCNFRRCFSFHPVLYVQYWQRIFRVLNTIIIPNSFAPRMQIPMLNVYNRKTRSNRRPASVHSQSLLITPHPRTPSSTPPSLAKFPPHPSPVPSTSSPAPPAVSHSHSSSSPLHHTPSFSPTLPIFPVSSQPRVFGLKVRPTFLLRRKDI